MGERYQKVLLNSQSYELASIKAGVPQGSILGPLRFLICINDRPEGITSNVKLFADDISIFSTVITNISTRNLNSDLQKVSEWSFKWKTSFNPDFTKQAQEVIFCRKLIRPVVHFN